MRFHGGEPDEIADFAQQAEAHGVESLWRGEHLIIPRQIRSTDHYYARGLAPGIESFRVLDPTTVLAYAAAHTERIRLGIGAFLLPLRHPIEAARQLMTLDVLSGGRLEVAVGVGWLLEEFAILGQAADGRGRRTEEAIALLRELWTSPHPQHGGEHYSMPPVTFEPKPVQCPHPPILISGVSTIALERAGRIGDGWYGHDLPPSEAGRCIERIQHSRQRSDRSGLPFTFTSRVRLGSTAHDIAALTRIGVDRVVVDLGSYENHGRDRVLRNLDDLARTVLAPLAKG